MMPQPLCELCRQVGDYANHCPTLSSYVSRSVNNPEGTFASPVWVVDSGATAHMTSTINNVTHPTLYHGTSRVTFGNGQSLPISHTGHSEASGNVNLHDVLVIPNLSKNLLSISKLTTDNQVDVLFSQPFFYIQDRQTKKVLATGRCEKGLYVLRDWPQALSAITTYGGRNARRNVYDFGRTFVVMPKATHTATIVWLHGIGEKGSSWTQILETFPLPNIKWICPSAPCRQITLHGGYPSTAWFNITSMSEDACDDLEGLDASATHVANLLISERDGIKLGVAGFSMGASVALYSATCRALGQYRNGDRYPINLSAAVALSGWLPCSRNLRNRVGASQEAARRASSLPVLVCHGQVDDVVEYKLGEKSAQTMISAGFQNLTFRTYDGLGHYANVEEINDVCCWLNSCLEA